MKYILSLFLLISFFYLNGQEIGFNWVNQIQGSSNGITSSQIDDNNNVYVSGTVNIGDNANPFLLTSDAYRDNYIIKFNQDGEPLWAKQIENSVDIGEVILDNNEDIFIVGSFYGNQDFDPDITSYEIQSSSNQNDAYLLKLTSDGNFSWVRSFGGNAVDLGRAIAIDELHNIYIGGWYSGSFDYSIGTEVFNVSSNGNIDCFILKFDDNGLPINLVTFGGAENDKLNTIASGNNSLYAFGNFKETVDFDPTSDIFNITIANTNPDSNSFILSLIDNTSIGVLDNSFIDKTINVYPNPTNEKLNIILSNQNYDFPIRMILRNSLGQIVQNRLLNEQFINQHHSILLTEYSGIYFLELYERKTIIKSFKIIKN